MKLQQDLREFIELLNARDVRYLIVGGYAVAFHGRPRYTGDIDVFVDSSAQNAKRVAEVLREFGAAGSGLSENDFTASDIVVQLGVEPNRIDLMTSISDVSFSEAWKTRERGELDSITVWFLSRDLLKRNKAAVGRKQDLADIDFL